MALHIIPVRTDHREQLIDITAEIESAVTGSGVEEGICYIFTPHTTAAITINENADPDVRIDFLKGLAHLNFDAVKFAHVEGNSSAHLKSSLVGCSEFVIVEDGRLRLGTWQGIYFCEFDGPRSRQVYVTVK
ncbi:MAG TPA: secondary thiamine-phosphate synthase enzyme YjbQ [Spirochaetota bacterium]|nr:secondary thiamine-phosphate synthase enzyme YjbQ [Spirochaetota bacterium]HPF07193.1 secondary thiamine-phosphate synthase enzyme YjbQ [Spirochaetota bacterium]HPJ43695.1 secondary thiamine-phosphate synthase enzyme YjbQ [Spirochaetota bacterium]HPR38702.1 secondary thiamine-phosphate synthase enzyme YjbQ [Spirochaetota bacterium]HRX48740.1 secondary thiamine-phosphate synthase enzyme YjbQ [Spirochaetota bacterium]